MVYPRGRQTVTKISAVSALDTQARDILSTHAIVLCPYEWRHLLHVPAAHRVSHTKKTQITPHQSKDKKETISHVIKFHFHKIIFALFLQLLSRKH